MNAMNPATNLMNHLYYLAGKTNGTSSVSPSVQKYATALKSQYIPNYVNAFVSGTTKSLFYTAATISALSARTFLAREEAYCNACIDVYREHLFTQDPVQFIVNGLGSSADDLKQKCFDAFTNAIPNEKVYSFCDRLAARYLLTETADNYGLFVCVPLIIYFTKIKLNEYKKVEESHVEQLIQQDFLRAADHLGAQAYDAQNTPENIKTIKTLALEILANQNKIEKELMDLKIAHLDPIKIKHITKNLYETAKIITAQKQTNE